MNDRNPEIRLDLNPEVKAVNKFNLLMALFAGQGQTKPNMLSLSYTTDTVTAARLGIPPTSCLDVMVTSVEAEDGSGESWNVGGYVTLEDRSYRARIYLRTDRSYGGITLQPN